jgi:hypothetical protein
MKRGDLSLADEMNPQTARPLDRTRTGEHPIVSDVAPAPEHAPPDRALLPTEPPRAIEERVTMLDELEGHFDELEALPTQPDHLPPPPPTPLFDELPDSEDLRDTIPAPPSDD